MPRPIIAAISKAILLLGAILILLALTGVAYEALGRLRDARRFPQRGSSIQAGRIKLNMDCTGDRSPGRTTIVLDSGLGAPALGWILIQPEVAKFARVCSYDRAGYGWSDPGPEPRTSSQIAKELKAVLDAAAERPPYVMVGHSFGGFNVRVFTSLYPGEVAGVVLVEASHEDEDTALRNCCRHQ
jgi:pimeloyl-ACP methyl ester carboxylesterase